MSPLLFALCIAHAQDDDGWSARPLEEGEAVEAPAEAPPVDAEQGEAAEGPAPEPAVPAIAVPAPTSSAEPAAEPDAGAAGAPPADFDPFKGVAPPPSVDCDEGVVESLGAVVLPDGSIAGVESLEVAEAIKAAASAEDLGAEQLGDLDADQVQWLKPKLRRLPQNPYAQTDFTAYTLEPGEVKLGIGGLSVGVFSNMEIGVSPLFYGLGVPNARLKIDAIQEGPVDIAVSGNRYQIAQGDRYNGSYTTVGSRVSWIVFPKWSLHLGGDYNMLKSDGLLDLDELNPLLTGQVDDAVDAASTQAEALFFADLVTARVATDIRFNRRDSIVLQGSSTVWTRLTADLSVADQEIEIPAVAGLDDLLDSPGPIPLGENYNITASWQFAWKRAELRLGAGLSSFDWAWLTQSIEFSYNLGGKTRANERRIRSTWRGNRKDVKQGEFEEPAG